MITEKQIEKYLRKHPAEERNPNEGRNGSSAGYVLNISKQGALYAELKAK